MTEPTSTQNPIPQSTETGKTLPGTLRCWMGSLMSGGLAIALYFLTASIAESFASKPIQSTNITVVNITVAVRTLVLGVSSLATGIFGLITVGLFALGIQVAIQRLKNPPLPPSDA